MYKIKNLITGHEFLLPDETAIELKDKFPADYKITEKNGKKYRDIKKTELQKSGSIKGLVIEK